MYTFVVIVNLAHGANGIMVSLTINLHQSMAELCSNAACPEAMLLVPGELWMKTCPDTSRSRSGRDECQA